ncbi:MAG: putative HTH domain antitoxin [Limisphaerales bacterium]|jgi:predicted HTH domain antitoxin
MQTELVEVPSEVAAAYGSNESEKARNITLQLAIDKYREGKWTTGHAAEAVGMGVIEFMDLLRDRKIDHPYTLEMVEEDFRNAGSSV